jgi:hypothetical protein
MEKGAAWAEPIAKIDAFITRIESKILVAVLASEVLALVLWVLLKAFSSDAADPRGRFLRAFFLAVILAGLGGGAKLLAKKRQLEGAWVEKLPVLLGVLGVALGLFLPGLLSAYTQNWLNWLQNASMLTLIGGLRGLVTRLTLWLALLGASLATAGGKHISIDFVLRAADAKTRTRLALLGWCAAAIMCFTGAWGFVDQLALGEYRAPRTIPCAAGDASKECESTPGMKLHAIGEEFGKDMFLLGKQFSLDLQTLPKVLSGARYDQWLTPAEWNVFASDPAFAVHYGAEKAATLLVAKDRTDAVLPAVIVPGGEENTAGLLVRDLNLVIPMGLFMIGLRFILRCLLVLAGRIIVDPNQVHADEEEATS